MSPSALRRVAEAVYDASPKPSSTLVIDGHTYEIALLDGVLTRVSADARMILIDAEPLPKN